MDTRLLTRYLLILAPVLLMGFISSQSFPQRVAGEVPLALADSLRRQYLLPREQWPAAWIDEGIDFEEIGPLPTSPYNLEAARPLIELGKILFHDPRLSGSNQISCSSCHNSDLHWTDGRRVSLGHDHKTTKRNTPSIENVWYLEKFFWDGRAGSLEEQAPQSISNPNEMNQDPALLPEKLRSIKGYYPLFEAAFGDTEINLDRIISALAGFQRTVTSRKTPFDNFLMGDSKALSNEQVYGLHLFRTKARCINCHHGPFFTDQQFHNLGLTFYKNPAMEDLGRYHVTKNPEDVGKFKTPSLRNAVKTGPWMHNGVFDDLPFMMNRYNVGMPSDAAQTALDRQDPMFPASSGHLHMLRLDVRERDAILSFLDALSAPSRRMDQPALPQ